MRVPGRLAGAPPSTRRCRTSTSVQLLEDHRGLVADRAQHVAGPAPLNTTRLRPLDQDRRADRVEARREAELAAVGGQRVDRGLQVVAGRTETVQAPVADSSSVSGRNVGRQSCRTVRASRSTSASGANAWRMPSGRAFVRGSMPCPPPRAAARPTSRRPGTSPAAGREAHAEVVAAQRRRDRRGRAHGLAVPAPHAPGRPRPPGARHGAVEREHVAAGAAPGGPDRVERAVRLAVRPPGEPRRPRRGRRWRS